MKLKIFGQAVSLKKEKGLANNKGLSGYYCPKDKVIVIDADARGDEFMLIKIHEVFHAMFDRIGLAQTGISRDVQEILAESVATVIVENFDLKPKRRKN